MRSIHDITRDRQAAEDRKAAALSETREITVRLHEESRTADAGEQERLARLERAHQKALADEDRLRDEWQVSMRDYVETHPDNLERPPEPTAETRERRPERDAAKRAIERVEKSGELTTEAAERADRLLSTGTPREQTVAARWAATTGDPAYSRAFMALLANPERGHLMWTPQEADAYRRVEETRAYMSLTDNVGGFMVPLALDPAIVLSNAGTTNAVRKVARVVQTTSEAWQGVTSAGSTAEWLAENTQAAEATPVLAAVPIPVYKASCFVPYSYEVGMDALNFGNELQRVLVDGVNNLTASAYTLGAGGTLPTGIVFALTGGASEINSIGSETFTAPDIFNLQATLPARWSDRASWMAHVGTINAIAQFETTGGMKMFPEVTNGRLLNRPIIENSNMDNATTINAGATENNYVLVYGDFTEYVIVDRIGATLEIIPNLMGANYRPTGSRGAFLWMRTGGNVTTINAFRMLDVPTTA